MSCIHCGAHTDPEQTICPDCQHIPTVTVLPPEENENFNGLTIEQAENGAGYNNSTESNPNPHIYVRHFSFGSTKGNLFTKLFLGAIFLFFVFLALPLALLILTFFAIFWFIKKILIR